MAFVHLLALAGQLRLDVTPEDFDEWGRDVPLLANVMPAGQHLSLHDGRRLSPRTTAGTTGFTSTP
jgi:dihydroxyacid dehydratase/phosphogluconate dehydratase